MGVSSKGNPAFRFHFARFGWGQRVKTTFRVHWGGLLWGGFFTGLLLSAPALADDMEIVFEKNVAAVTPEMEVLPSNQGSLSATGGRGLDYHTSGLQRLKEKGINIWTEEGPSMGQVPQLTPQRVLESGFILSEESFVGSITQILGENRMAAAEGMVVYLDIGKESGLAPGDRLTVFSEKRLVRHPVTMAEGMEFFPLFDAEYHRDMGDKYAPVITAKKVGKKLGRLARMLGVVDILDVAVGSSKAIVQTAFDVIAPGDLVAPYQEPAVAPRAASSGKSIEGYVVAFQNPTMTALVNDIIYIDRGSEDGVRPGDVFQIYIAPKKKKEVQWYEIGQHLTYFSRPKENYYKPDLTPPMPRVIGELQVIATQPTTATALVLDLVEDLQGPGQMVRYKP